LVHEKKLELDTTSGTNSAYPSFTLAGEKIYLGAQNGVMMVLEPGREYAGLRGGSYVFAGV
jgi:hypothetical protein